MSLTAEDVTGVEFATASIARRGYAKDEVDRFVARIAATLAGEDDLTAAEVHHVAFGKPLIGKRGYDEREVDDLLDQAEAALATRTGVRGYQVPGAREQSQATEQRAQAHQPLAEPAPDYQQR